MPSPLPTYTTKELSKKTWPDFVRLFSQGSGWDFCQCMHFQRPRSLPKEQWLRTRAERGVRNRRQKRALVEQGRAHGILVYANGEPVGWCQYGPREELPRIDNKRIYQGLAPKGPERLWRITCFAKAPSLLPPAARWSAMLTRVSSISSWSFSDASSNGIPTTWTCYASRETT